LAPTSFNALTTESFLNDIYKFSSHLTGNTLRLRYKDEPVNAARETIAVYCDNRKEHTNIFCEQNAEFKYCSM
jgi:hypothetical protein